MREIRFSANEMAELGVESVESSQSSRALVTFLLGSPLSGHATTDRAQFCGVRWPCVRDALSLEGRRRDDSIRLEQRFGGFAENANG